MLYEHVFVAVIPVHPVFKLPPHLLHLCAVNSVFPLQQKECSLQHREYCQSYSADIHFCITFFFLIL